MLKNPSPSQYPISLGFIIYDQVSLNETVSKSSHFYFILTIVIFIKPSYFKKFFILLWLSWTREIISFFPGLKENLSRTNVYQQCNFFCKKLKPLDTEKGKEHQSADDRQTPRKLKGKRREPSRGCSSMSLLGQGALSSAKSTFKMCNSQCSLDTDQSEQKCPRLLCCCQALTLSLRDGGERDF